MTSEIGNGGDKVREALDGLSEVRTDGRDLHISTKLHGRWCLTFPTSEMADFVRRAMLVSYAEDAARYRWLRDNVALSESATWAKATGLKPDGERRVYRLEWHSDAKGDLDEIIDAARGPSGEKP